MKFVVILSPSCIVFFQIVSNSGTMLEVNLRCYRLSPNSKKLYLVSFVQLKNPYLVFTTLVLSKILFQLRLGLSQWRSRTKNHSFVDTPSNLCICNLEAENTEHLFCRCSILSIPRLFLVDMVSDIFSQEIIPITNLNGNPSFKVSDTRLILLATIKFITDSNRFVKEDWQYFRLKFFLVYLIYFVLKTIFR